jgi:hypothetical protein
MTAFIRRLADDYRRREALRPPLYGPVHTGTVDAYFVAGIYFALALATGVVAFAVIFS